MFVHVRVCVCACVAGLVALSIARALLRSRGTDGIVLLGDAGTLTNATRPRNTIGNLFWHPALAAKRVLVTVNPTGDEILWLCRYLLSNGDERCA